MTQGQYYPFCIGSHCKASLAVERIDRVSDPSCSNPES